MSASSVSASTLLILARTTSATFDFGLRLGVLVSLGSAASLKNSGMSSSSSSSSSSPFWSASAASMSTSMVSSAGRVSARESSMGMLLRVQ